MLILKLDESISQFTVQYKKNGDIFVYRIYGQKLLQYPNRYNFVIK